MTGNPLRHGFDAGQVGIGTWVTRGSPLVAEMCAVSGFDVVCIDLQHGIAGVDSLVSLLMGAGSAEAALLVRVGQRSAQQIGLALDLGACGVIAPMVNTAEEAELLVRAARYSPIGDRSFGSTRSRLHLNRGRTPAEVNDEVLCLAMIETPEGVANAERICGVSGLDGVYLGPSDLAVACDEMPGQDEPPPAVRRALQTVRNACADHGLLAEDEGFPLISIGTDAAVLRTAYASELAAAQKRPAPITATTT